MKALLISFVIAVTLSPTLALAGPRAAVTVSTSAAGAGLADLASLRTAKVLVEESLAQQGLSVARELQLLADLPAAERRAQLSRHHLERLYELSVLPMGRKLLVRLAERDVASDRVTHAARMAASSFEELDVVLPRLVSAVVRRVALEQTERVDTVSDAEGRRWRKKAGELLFGGTVVVGSAAHADEAAPIYGGEFNTAYEMPHVRLALDLGGMGGDEDAPGHFFTGIRAFYLLSTKSISPFFGGGMGFMVASDGHAGDDRLESKAGAALTASAGVELFRMHRARLIAEVEGRFPLFVQERYRFDEVSYDRTKVATAWAPVVMFKLGLLFGRGG